MFNYETIQNFLKRDSTEAESYAIEKAKDILKKYECFSKLLNGREELFNQCKDIILKDLLTMTRSSTSINRDYLVGYQDAVDVFLKNLDMVRAAHDELFK